MPDEEQRGAVFGKGESKSSESGQAGDAHPGAGNIEQVSTIVVPLSKK